MDKANHLNEISVFFPFYNEEENITPTTEMAIKVFNGIADKFEIILINDGSTDKTEKMGKRLQKKYKFVRMVSQNNSGYGGAIKRGLTESKYEWVFFSDGDLQFDLNEIRNLMKYTKRHKCIIGYRKNRSEGFKRKIVATILRYWNYLFLHFPIYIKDIDCAFKLIHKDILKTIEPLKTSGAMISTEILLKIHLQGEYIKQVPVSHYPRVRGNPSGADFRVIIKAIKETFLLRSTIKNWNSKQNS